MKQLLALLLLFFSVNSFSQEDNFDEIISEIKKDARTDKNDQRIYKIFEAFYEQSLQSESGELKQETINEIQAIYEKQEAGNIYLLTMFMTYQQHITETVAAGKNPDSKFQVKLMTELEKEILSVYSKVPAIIYIYKVEAFDSDGQHAASVEAIQSGLKVYPDSVPLKVYYYLNTKDKKVKSDLLKHHKNHWMVKQFAI